jgi:hypothetical protein
MADCIIIRIARSSMNHLVTVAATASDFSTITIIIFIVAVIVLA